MQHQLDQQLKRINRRVLLNESLTTVLSAGAMFIVFFILAILIDSVLGLPLWGLILTDAVLTGVLVYGFTWLVGTVRRYRYEPKRTARMIESRTGLVSNDLINSVELAGLEADSILAKMAVDKGDAAIEKVKPDTLLNKQSLRRAMLGFAVSILGFMSLWIAVPDLFATVIPRLLLPSGDHPAYTLTKFEIEVQPVPVQFGGPAKITAKIDSPQPVNDVWVVFENQAKDDQASAKMYMLQNAEGAYTLALSSVREATRFYVATDSGRSAWHELTVDMRPRVEKVLVRYIYPTYTKWQDANFELSNMPIEALRGTRVRLEIISNVGLKGGVMTLRTEDGKARTIEAQVDESNTAIAAFQFEVQDNGYYEINLTGGTGAKSVSVWSGKVKVLEDLPPKVTILQPEREVIAPENWEVKVLVRVSDDIGVTKLVINRSVNQWGPTEVELQPKYAGSRTDGVAEYTFDLKALGARGGDVISYFATGYDNLPGAAQSADSEMGYIYVITEEEYQSLVKSEEGVESLTREVEELQKAMDDLQKEEERLAKEMEELQKKIESQGGNMRLEDQDRFEQLKREMEDLAKNKQALSDQMKKRAEEKPLFEDLEKEFQQKLDEMSEQLKKEAEEMKKSAQQMNGANPLESLRKAQEQLQQQPNQNEQEFQHDLQQRQQDLELLGLAAKMMQQMDRIANVADMQKELAEKMSRFNREANLDPADAKALQRLGELQQELRDELNDATAELDHLAEQAAGSLPRMAKSAGDIVGQIREMQIEPDQRDAANHAHDQEGTEAYTKAKSAADKLDELIKSNSAQSLQGNGQSTQGDLDGLLGFNRQQMSNLLNQLGQGQPGRGFGSQPGQTPGQGMGNGQGASPGSSGLSGMGQGSRSGGSRQMSMVGPNQNRPQLDGPRSNRSGFQSGNRPGTGEGPGGRWVGDAGSGAERIRVDDIRREREARGMLGVSPRYRNLAELYFRRLNEVPNNE